MQVRKILQIVIIAILVVGLFGSVPPSQAVASSKVQPELAALAVQDPAQMVHVIVQSVAGADGAEESIAALSGQITRELQIIHAFSATMSAGNAVQLARAGSVRMISLDAMMESSACT